MSFLHFYDFSRLAYLLALILVLPLVACSGGDAGLSSSGDGVLSSTGSNVSNLSWVAPSEREDGTGLSPSEIAGFRIYYGAKSGDYSNTVNIDDHTATQAVLAGLPSGTYFVVVTAVDVDGRESTYSDEVEVVVTL